MRLRLNQIGKSFRAADSAHAEAQPLRILHELNLDVTQGEILAVVGESGSGKSTLLSLLAGFENPDQGEIFWDGQSTSPWNESHWADFRKSKLGFVFQNYHLIPYLTALENVELPLRLLDKTPQLERRTQAEKILQTLGLGERLDHLPHQLSGGEAQRVGIGRALIHNPQLVLADEPTGSLDSQTGLNVLNTLFDLLKGRQQTAMIVTHSNEVAKLCDRTLTLREGRLWSS